MYCPYAVMASSYFEMARLFLMLYSLCGCARQEFNINKNARERSEVKSLVIVVLSNTVRCYEIL